MQRTDLYQVFGINCQSQLVLSSNAVAKGARAHAPVSLAIGERAVQRATTPTTQSVGKACFVDASTIWLDIPSLGQFEIKQAEIAVELCNTACHGLVQVYLQGYALGVQAMLRQQLVLHATALCRNGKAIILCGESGSGKSSLAAALLLRGFCLVSDEVSVINHQSMIEVGFSDIKVTPACIDALGLPSDNLVPIDALPEKLMYQPSQRAETACPVAAVYILQNEPESSHRLRRCDGFEKFSHLRANAYRPYLLEPLNLSGRFLQLCGEHLAKPPLFLLNRPMNLSLTDSLQELADSVHHNAQSLGI